MLLHARHLAAEAVAARRDGHGIGAVGRGLHQHRNLQPRQANRIHDAALFAEVGQRNDDAVDLLCMFLEEFGAMLRFGVCFHRAIFGLLRAENDRARSRSLQY